MNGNGISHDSELTTNGSSASNSGEVQRQDEDATTEELKEIEEELALLNCEVGKKDKKKKKKKKYNSADHPHHEKRDPPKVSKNDDGTWGPTGLYGGRVKETPLLRALRDTIKSTRLERVEKVLQARCQRVQCLFENLCDPANGAACLRTMEGLGLLEAHAVESYEPFRVQGGITINADKVSKLL